jgi:hypothetical protein
MVRESTTEAASTHDPRQSQPGSNIRPLAFLKRAPRHVRRTGETPPRCAKQAKKFEQCLSWSTIPQPGI